MKKKLLGMVKFQNIGFITSSLTILFLTISTISISQTTFSWRNDQNPTSGQWNNVNYWWNGSSAVLPGGGEILYLDGSVGLTMTNDLPSINRHKIIFGSGGSSRVVNGSTENTFYDYSSNKPKIENSSSVNQTINFPIKVGFNPLELNPINGDLTITSVINNNGNYIDVYGSNNKVLTISNNITGAGGITLKQNSTIVLSTTDKAFTGATVLDAGILELSVNLSSSSITVKSGSKLSIIGTNVTINSLTIESGGIVEVQADKSLTISGSLANSAGTSGLVIKNGGSLITNGSVSGSATIQQLIASDNKWHFISSPVSSQSICDGVFAPLVANFNETTGATYDFYKWSEPTVAGGFNWLNLKSSDWTLNTAAFGEPPQFDVKAGYLVAYSPSFAGSSTKAFSGVLITGDQTVTLGNSGTKWNLIGNPFASAINWDLVTKTGLASGYYYVYNENKTGGAGYESYLDESHKTTGANGKISTTQGFFVEASGTSLILPNSSRVHNINWMKNTESEPVDQLKLMLSNANNFDETFIQFESQGTNIKDFFDASKMFSINSQIPQIYTLVEDEIKIAINSMPYNSESFVIPLGMYFPADGLYSFSISGIESFTSNPQILLIDNKLNIVKDMTVNPYYEFTASSAEDINRFVLNFDAVTVGLDKPTTPSAIHIYSNNGKIFVTGAKDNSELMVRNMVGQVVLKLAVSGENLQTINAGNLTPGIYVVSLISGSQVVSEKVVIGD